MLKIKKSLKLFLLLFTTVFMFTLFSSIKPHFKASNANIRYINTAVGEDEVSVGINYHCDVPGSYVMLGRSYDLSDAVKYEVTEKVFSHEMVNNDNRTGFSERYVCSLSLCCLKEDAYYYYQVVAGEEKSSIHSFKTYSPTGTSCDILFTTDLHAASSYDTSKKANPILNNICLNGDIKLVIQTGDQVDRGGYESEWQTFFNGYTCFDNKVLATVPGNHEYYHSSAGSYVSPLYYNQFFNNPKNGPEERLNSTYTFTRGNLRVIMIDTINRQYFREQAAWFRNVMDNNQCQWVIVGTHAGAISAGAYADDAKWTYLNWGPLFEEYQIDLALSGHEHIYIRKDLAYKGETNPDLGITYLVGCAGSHKQYDPRNTDGFVISHVNYSSNIIKIRDNKLTCTLYNEEGKATDYTFSLTAKRPSTITPLTDDELLNKLSYNYNKEDGELTVKWNKGYYGNVRSVEIDKTVNKNDNTTTYTYPISSEKIVSASLTSILKDYNYEFVVRINKKDGNVLTKKIDVVNRYEHKLNLILKEGHLDNPENYTTYYDGAYSTLPTPKLDDAYFDGWYQEPDFSGQAYTRIPDTFTGDLTFYGKFNYYNYLRFNTFDKDQIFEPLRIKAGDKVELPLLQSDSTKIFFGWHLKEDLTDDVVFNLNIEKNEDITVYAEWESLIPEPEKPIDNPDVPDKPVDNTPKESETKKKCGKKATMFLELFSFVSLIYIFIRKKH